MSANVLSYTLVHLHKHLKFAPTSHKKRLKKTTFIPNTHSLAYCTTRVPGDGDKDVYFPAGSDSKIQRRCRETGSCAT